MTDRVRWSGVRALVTGGTGFIGVNLCRRLAGEGATVTILSRRADAASTPGLPPVEVAAGDVRDEAALVMAMETARPRIVFHLASTSFNPPGTPDDEHRDVIVNGTAAVLAAASRFDARVVHAGSAAEYGSGARLREDHPLSPATALGRAKAEASRLVVAAARSGVDAVVLRLFTPYGGWDRPGRLVLHAALRALDGTPVPISDGRQQRDFVYIDDVVVALLLAASRATSSPVINIASGEGVSVRGVVELVIATLRSASTIEAGVIATRLDEIWQLTGDNTLALRELGWAPSTDLAAGIARTCAWVVAHRERLGRAAEPVRS